jgi:hypothetical protein
MPDGEVLFGKYSALSNTSPVYETGVGVATGSHRGSISVLVLPLVVEEKARGMDY